MIPSKLRAYNYRDGEWETVNRWSLVKMSEVEFKKFKDLNFPLYLKKSTESPKLTFNRGQKTFRFYPGILPDDKKGSSGLTISHQIAQEVISDLRVLNLKLTDKRFKPYKKVDLEIEADQIFEEFPTTAGDNNYVVDLLVVFSKPTWLALKWNRTLALEVFVTNDVRGKKIIDFEQKRVAMVEVVIGSKLKSNKSASETTEEEESKLRQIMRNAFSKQIFGDLLVDTTSTKYLENELIQELTHEVSSLKASTEKYKNRLSEVKSENEEKQIEINTLKSHLNRLKTELRNKSQNLGELKTELGRWEFKSKFQRFLDLLRK